jgi:hypothetical protein
MQSRAGGVGFFKRRHKFRHRLVALRKQYLGSGLHLFNQIGKLSCSDFRCDYHAKDNTPFRVGRRVLFNDGTGLVSSAQLPSLSWGDLLAGFRPVAGWPKWI